MKSFWAKFRIYTQLLQTLSLILICLVCIVFSIVVGFGNNDNLESSNTRSKEGIKRQESFAKGVKYFVYKDENPALFLDARELMSNESQKLTMFYNPIGVVYSNDQTPIEYKALSGKYDGARQIVSFKDEVEITTKDSIMEARKVVYNIAGDIVTCTGDVETRTKSEVTGDAIVVTADRVISRPQKRITSYYSNVKGQISRERQYEESLYFDSNVMKLNLNKSKVDLDGDVRIKKQGLRASSHRGEIYLENYNKKLKYFVLYDDVQVKEEIKIKGTPIIHRKAFAEKLEGIMSENIYVLTGFPKVFQDKDVIRGNKIILRENNEVVEIDDVSTNFILE